MPVVTLVYMIEMAEGGPIFRRALQCQNADRPMVIQEAITAIPIDVPGKFGKISQLSTFLQ